MGFLWDIIDCVGHSGVRDFASVLGINVQLKHCSLAPSVSGRNGLAIGQFGKIPDGLVHL